MSTFRSDVKELRAAAAAQGDVRKAVRDRDETIRGETASDETMIGVLRGFAEFLSWPVHRKLAESQAIESPPSARRCLGLTAVSELAGLLHRVPPYSKVLGNRGRGISATFGLTGFVRLGVTASRGSCHG